MIVWPAIVWLLSLFGLWKLPESSDLTSSSTGEIYEFGPPLPDYGNAVHEAVLVKHKFGNSWGKPAIVTYTPPDIEFNAVVLTIDWTVAGVQYDRLAHIYLNDIEIWRPSTPEPGGRLVHSNFSIDASTYLQEFKKEGKLELELNNLLSEGLTGIFNTTLSISYYNTNETVAPVWLTDRVPDKLVPVVKRTAYAPPALVGHADAVSPNTTRAVLEVIASGYANEEFWYADADINRAIRVLAVYIDDILAGFIDPYPVVFTGGFQPRLWWPLVGIHTYDVPRYHVDVTPFLPLLWSHGSKIEVRVGNSKDWDIETGQSWPIAATLLTWEESDVKGVPSAKEPAVFFSTDPTTVHVPGIATAHIIHSFFSSNTLDFGSGPVPVAWNQSLIQSNTQVWTKKEDIYTYEGEGTAGYNYGTTDDVSSHGFELALVLTRRDIAVGLKHEAEISSERSVVSLNATWGPTSEQNGTDVFVKLGRGYDALKRHSKARNGNLVKFNEPYTGKTSIEFTKAIIDHAMDADAIEDDYEALAASQERRDYWFSKKLH